MEKNVQILAMFGYGSSTNNFKSIRCVAQAQLQQSFLLLKHMSLAHIKRKNLGFSQTCDSGRIRWSSRASDHLQQDDGSFHEFGSDSEAGEIDYWAYNQNLEPVGWKQSKKTKSNKYQPNPQGPMDHSWRQVVLQ